MQSSRSTTTWQTTHPACPVRPSSTCVARSRWDAACAWCDRCVKRRPSAASTTISHTRIKPRGESMAKANLRWSGAWVSRAATHGSKSKYSENETNARTRRYARDLGPLGFPRRSALFPPRSPPWFHSRALTSVRAPAEWFSADLSIRSSSEMWLPLACAEWGALSGGWLRWSWAAAAGLRPARGVASIRCPVF